MNNLEKRTGGKGTGIHKGLQSGDPSVKVSHQEKTIFRQKSILIVEDDKDMCGLLAEYLGKEFTLFFAYNGKEALDKIVKIPEPDLIISDICMKEMDGFQLLTELQKHKRFKAIPFIILSVRTNPDDKLKGFMNGANDYIEKPFSVQELQVKIKTILKKQQLLKEKLLKEIKNTIIDITPIRERREKQTSTGIVKYIEPGFSKREAEIARLLISGFLYKEIAHKLKISETTVAVHVRHILKKTGAKNKADLPRIAQAWHA